MNRDLGHLDTAALAMLALGALACITVYSIARAIAWCWRVAAPARGVIPDLALGIALGVPLWLWAFPWFEALAL